MGGGDVVGHQANFDAQRFSGRVSRDVAAAEVHGGEFVGGEGQGSFTGFEFAVGA